MPPIYQGVCDKCGHKTAVMMNGYGAVFVDQPVSGIQHPTAGAVVVSDSSESLAVGSLEGVEDPRFVVLAHPCESSILASTGFSWSDLLWQGRFVLVTNVICRQCGGVFPKRQLGAPGTAGGLTAIIVGAIIGVAVGIAQRSFFWAFIAFLGAAVVLLLVFERTAIWYVRWRYHSRAAALAAESRCPICGTDDSVIISLAKGVKCPTCKRESLSVEIAGMS
jgi:hypothetical protein